MSAMKKIRTERSGNLPTGRRLSRNMITWSRLFGVACEEKRWNFSPPSGTMAASPSDETNPPSPMLGMNNENDEKHTLF
jgi:hypothetical protein